MNLLERLDIVQPDPPIDDAFVARLMSQCNVIGLDFGDGDINAATVLRGQPRVIRQMKITNSALNRRPNAITALPVPGEHGLSHVKWLEVNEPRANASALLFYSFKRAPGSSQFQQAYMHPDERGKNVAATDGCGEPVTNGRVMALAFAQQVEDLLEMNDPMNSPTGDYWDPELPTLIYVGCPASHAKDSPWYGRERDYEAFLQESLADYAYSHPDSHLALAASCGRRMELCVLPEPVAAIAYETNRDSSIIQTNGANPGRLIMLIDLGSSTTDFACSLGGQLMPSLYYSCSLGGHIFEEAMLGKLGDDMERAGLKLVYADDLKFELRQCKEQYYASGISVIQVCARDAADPGGEVKKHSAVIDDAFMRAVETGDWIESPLPPMAHAGLGAVQPVGESGAEMTSLRAAYRDMFLRYRALLEESLRLPDQVIVTGGVSLAPWTLELIQEVFGVEALVQPDKKQGGMHVSVARGLALKARNDLIVGSIPDAILGQAHSCIDPLFADGAGTLADMLADAAAKGSMDIADETIRQWVGEPGSPAASLNDWKNQFFVPALTQGGLKAISDSCAQAVMAWWQALSEDAGGGTSALDRLKEIFLETYRRMFGDGQFRLDLDNGLNAIKGALQGIRLSVKYYPDALTYFYSDSRLRPFDRDVPRPCTSAEIPVYQLRRSRTECYRKHFHDVRSDVHLRLKREYARYFLSPLKDGSKSPVDMCRDAFYDGLGAMIEAYCRYLTN